MFPKRGDMRDKSLPKIAIAVVLVIFIAVSIWFATPTKALDVTFPSLPTSGTLGSTYSFQVKVDIDGLKGTFTVKAAPPVPVPPKPMNWWLIGSIIAGVIVIGVVVFLVIRRNEFMKSLLTK